MIYLTPSDVRTWLVDETPQDNELLQDIDFSEGQIRLAMKLAASAFNDMEPRILFVEQNKLPLAEWSICAVQEQLYRMRLNQLERNAVVYQAGNVGFDEDNARITNLRDALGRISEGWRTTARAMKMRRNLSECYGDLG